MALSWVLSPAVSGLVGAITYLATKALIFDSARPLQRALVALPALYSTVTVVMVYLILSKSGPTKDLDPQVIIGAALAAGAVAVLVTQFYLIPCVGSSVVVVGCVQVVCGFRWWWSWCCCCR